MKKYYAELTMQANKIRISNGLECSVTLTLLVTSILDNFAVSIYRCQPASILAASVNLLKLGKAGKACL